MLRPDIGKAFPNFKDAGRSGFFWMLDATPLAAGTHVVRVVARSRSGHSQEWTRNFTLASSTPYQQWMTTNALGPKEKKKLVARAKRLMPKSTVTIVMVSKSAVDHDALSRSMASLAGQIYQNFKLIIVVPAKEEAQHIQSAVAAAGMAERLHLVLSEQPHWLDSRDSCDGDFVGVMDIGDVLDPRALLAVAENIARDFSIDLLYADEDRIGNGVRTMPTFKPAFSPIYLDRYNYIGRPWFARTALIKEETTREGQAEGEPIRTCAPQIPRALRAGRLPYPYGLGIQVIRHSESPHVLIRSRQKYDICLKRLSMKLRRIYLS